MAENNFLAGMRTEQFIKTNNEQITTALDDSLKGVTKSVSDVLKLQKISTKTIGDIDDKLKSVESIDKTVSKIYDIQKTQLKLQESGGKNLSKTLDTLMSRSDTRMDKLISGMRKKDKGAVVAPTVKSFFKREGEGEERDELLETISGGIGTLVGFEKKKKTGKGLFGALGITGAIGAFMSAGGLMGYLMTGKKELLYSVTKGLKWTGKGLLTGLKGALGLGDLAKSGGGLLKGFDTLGDIAKGAKNLFKIFQKFGFKGLIGKGAKTFAKTTGKAGGKSLLKKIPGIGLVMGLGFGAKRIADGDIVGGLLEFASGAASTLPVVGTAASIAIDLYSLKRDLSTTPQEIADQAKVLTDPVGSVKTLLKGRRDRKEYEESQSLDPSFQRGIANLRSLSMEQRRAFSDWQTRTYGSTLNVSNNSEKAQYGERVAEYRKSLGIGGGGFGMDDDLIANKNKTYFGVDVKKKKSLFRRRRRSGVTGGTGAIYNNAGKDDTFVTGPSAGFNVSLKKLMSGGYNDIVRLNGASGYQPDLYGVNSTMRNKFFSMAEDFHNRTGGYLLVNSAKRSGGGSSVHNMGYAIDVNAIGPDGQRIGDGYVPEDLLSKYGFHRPLIKWKSIYGGPLDEPWHIEPFPGASSYGGPRNSLAPNQPYREGVLLAGGNAYSSSSEVGGGGFNLPQGTVEKQANTGSSEVRLSVEDIERLASAFGKQIRENTPTPEKAIVPSSSGANGRSNI